MKYILILIALINGTANADGMRVAQGKNYQEFSGTRLDSSVYGTMGFFKASDSYGMRLSIGPELVTVDSFAVRTLYAIALSDYAEVSSTWNEFELLATYKWVGISVGHAYGIGQEVLQTETPVKVYIQLEW